LLKSANTVSVVELGNAREKAVNHNFTIEVKVKCTLVQALRLCTGPTAHRGSRGIRSLS